MSINKKVDKSQKTIVNITGQAGGAFKTPVFFSKRSPFQEGRLLQGFFSLCPKVVGIVR